MRHQNNKMIATQQIKSTASKPFPYKDYTAINVLKWKNSKWKSLCPYYLKTDGDELCYNPGNILFENFYQGLKVYDIIYENEVYPSRYFVNKPQYLWWKYTPSNKDGDIIINNNEINYENYFKWRDELWKCTNPIRYPNKIHRRKNTQFALFIDKEGKEIRMDYLTARREIYITEYVRLIKQLPEYTILLNKLKKGENIMICEIDVPSQKKRGNYGTNCNENNICELSLQHLQILLNDPSEAFGHGLCLAYALLLDIESEI
jgi:hypothetical protein